MGIIIPPSIIFIVYGYLMNLSISDLFIAGIIPGALMVFAMQFACWIICRLNGWGHLIPLNLNRILKTGFGAWLGFFAIGLVLWGIYTGKFSPTEAAGVTVGFCLIVGVICYPINKLMKNDANTPVNDKTYADMLVVEGFKLTEIPSVVVRSAQITIILAPILAPIAATVGIDPIHFSVIFLVGASIGFITPPYGLNLYVASGVTGVPYFKLLKYTMPYLIALISIWILVALTPQLALDAGPGNIGNTTWRTLARAPSRGLSRPTCACCLCLRKWRQPEFR